MLPSNKTLLAAIVCSALTMSACGHKKSGASNDSRNTQVTTESAPAPAQAPATGGPAVPGPVGGGLDQVTPTNGELDRDNKPTPPPIQANEVKYDALDPRNVEKNDVTKRLTGAHSEDGLVYTGSSVDFLLTFLRTRMENVKSDAVKKNNLTLAKMVRSAQLRIGESGDVMASIKLNCDGANDNTVLHLGGATNSDAFAPLKLSIEDQKRADLPKADGEFRCLDLNGTCETSMLRLSLNVKGTIGVVNIVFRNSLADLHVRFPSKPSESPEYMNIENFVRNAEYNRDTKFKIKELRMESFEVVNGRSGFKTTIYGANDEVMAFGGPLLAPEFGTALNITANRTAELTESLDLEKIGARVSNLSDTISTAKIVNNNGLGQVRLSLTLRKRAGFDPDTIYFTVMRVSKPIIYLSEESVYQKK